ncbi:erythromycin esterase family protein [Streptomyces montanus]|uniref:Erythromycin esterase family protein n=1 Tax=Streptomyces montanus TaxID=2580423 RepID=A0A5R9FRB8_9ACTN|nr:erythromycin esterase family protein [Streptomyces montanus]TLS46512.1 erythromycin esterase family protein [Streptomyces montanus]
MTAVAAGADEVRRIRRDALPLSGPGSLDELLERIGDARYVLLGEATHGTAEYYEVRALLTRRLIEEKGFSFVAVEGDWPDCLALHCSVTGAQGAPEDPQEVLESFRRWPAWLWANTEVLAFTRWLREHNARLPAGRRVGFFGLDVYSLWESLHAVLDHLRAHDPDLVDRALEAYRRFEPYAEDPQTYARATELVPDGCEPEVVALLTGLRARAVAGQSATLTGDLAEIAALQNAEVLAGVDRYYRAMLHGGAESWNLRDRHMADTLDRLMEHHGPDAKAVVWEHNTHIGDARATDMFDAGLVNVGQLARERHLAEGVVLVGLGSYEGTVLAADRWGARPAVLGMPPARDGSVEQVMHQAVPGERSLFVFPPGTVHGRPLHDEHGWIAEERAHRAIGVVYRPQDEQRQWGNYVPTVLGERYDAFCFLDRTQALTPLHSHEET